MFSLHSISARRGVLSSLTILGLTTSLAACQGAPGDSDSDSDSDEEVGSADLALCNGNVGYDPVAAEARRLFEKETFGGNGRTCLSCHKKNSGTLSPEQAQALFAANPADPLFGHDGSDDFQGSGVTRILADATILIRLSLPPNITLASDPTATSIVVPRGIPTLLDTPALDPVLMLDGRAPNLLAQAKGAVHGHAQSTVEPTAAQLALIAQHEKTSSFFSSTALQAFANGGPVPKLPAAYSPAQVRGRRWFEDAPVPVAINSQTPRQGLCATCHSGPLLNETNGFGSLPLPPFPTTPAATTCDQPATQASPVPKGKRFASVLISELNVGNGPTFNFLLELPGGAKVPLPPFADPGRALVTGNFKGFPAPDGDLFKFKIPNLRGIKKTAPYFHNNSAKTLEAVVEHYTAFFAIATDCNIDGDPPLILTAQDKADLLAFLKLL